ncbi:MAG: hypothetical protein MZV49_05470 [Rhodopseudomonas palustris]|nr:hypothetical protein [Rhodopseudomonas palustris]
MKQTTEIIGLLKSHYVDAGQLDQKRLTDATIGGLAEGAWCRRAAAQRRGGESEAGRRDPSAHARPAIGARRDH